MTTIPYGTALIVGAGSDISASVARGLAMAGLKVGVAARNVDKLAMLAAEAGAERFTVGAPIRGASPTYLKRSTSYNAAARAHGPIAALDLERSAKRSGYRHSAAF